MVRGLLGENMIYPEFDKFSIENLQQQLIVLYAQIAQERQIYTNILSPDFKPAAWWRGENQPYESKQ